MPDAESEYLTIMFAEVDNCTETILDIIKDSQGQLISDNDGQILSAFANPDLSVQAAIKVMEGLKESSLSARIGCQTGFVWKTNDQPSGAVVDVAADIGRMARPNQILLGENTKENLSQDYRIKTKSLDSPSCSRLVSTRLYEMDWEDVDQTQIVKPAQPTKSTSNRSFILQFRNRIAALNKSVNSFSLGRGEDCDLQINSSAASRIHALLKYESGRAILSDQSTNGTYIQTPAGEEIYLYNSEQILLGDWTISLGRPIAENEKWLIHITCKFAEETED